MGVINIRKNKSCAHSIFERRNHTYYWRQWVKWNAKLLLWLCPIIRPLPSLINVHFVINITMTLKVTISVRIDSSLPVSIISSFLKYISLITWELSLWHPLILRWLEGGHLLYALRWRWFLLLPVTCSCPKVSVLLRLKVYPRPTSTQRQKNQFYVSISLHTWEEVGCSHRIG